MELKKMPDKLFTKKLLKTADHLDELEFQNKVTGDPRILKEFNFIQKIWDEAGKVKVFEQIDPKADWNIVGGKIGNLQRKYHRIPVSGYFLRIAALLILTCGLSAGFYRLLIITKKGDSGFTAYNADHQKKEIILPDGSAVTLNKGADLTFRDGFGISSRDVILNGDAFFNVVKGSALPFRVFSGESMVQVTGTKFSVYQVNGKVHVSVISGTVLLAAADNKGKTVSLSANHTGYVSAPDILKVEEGIPDNVLSWKTGQLLFDATPIDSALIDIAHHFSRELSFETRVKESITARFQDQPLREILEEITLVTGLKFDTTGTALIVRK